MTGAVPLLGNRTEGRTTAEKVLTEATTLLLLPFIYTTFQEEDTLFSRCTVLGMSKKYHNEL